MIFKNALENYNPIIHKEFNFNKKIIVLHSILY
jgi:hypothetical protein